MDDSACVYEHRKKKMITGNLGSNSFEQFKPAFFFN